MVANMTFSTRLNMVFGLLEIILGIVIGTSLWRMHQLSEHMSEVTEVNNVEARDLNAMRSAVYEQSLAARDLILAPDAAAAHQQAVRLSAQLAMYRQAEQNLRRMFDDTAVTTGHERKTMALIEAQAEEAHPMLERLVAAGLAGELPGRGLLSDDMVTLQMLRRETLAGLARFEDELSDRLQIEAGDAYRLGQMHIVALGLVALVLGTLGAWRVARSILEELGGEPSYATMLARALAAGDLTRHIAPGCGDGRSLLAAMQTLSDNLKCVAARVRRGTQGLVGAGTQIANGHLELAARAEQQAASMRKLRDCLQQLALAGRGSQGSIDSGDRLAAALVQQCARARGLAQGMVATMHVIDVAFLRVFDIARAMEHRALQGGSVQADIPFVEAPAVPPSQLAAQGGWAGQTAAEIRQQIGDAARAVDAVNRQVAQVQAQIDEIEGQSAEVGAVMRALAEAAHVQERSVREIERAARLIEEVARHNVVLVGQSAVTAHAMLGQACELGKMAAAFKVEEGKPINGSAQALLPAAGLGAPQGQTA